MLDERKLKVLKAIINSYIVSAEPIGSKTVSKEYNLGVSSATIRNEMSDLEELGYLNKPHTSAGRIPSDKAYRLYVNELLKLKSPTVDVSKKNEIKDVLIKGSWEMEDLIQNSVKILSAITSYTALIATPKLNTNKIRTIKLVPIDLYEILIVIVTDTGIIKNSIVKLDKTIPKDHLEIISNFLNEKLKGLSFDEIIADENDELYKDVHEFINIIKEIILVIEKSMEDLQVVDIYADGLAKILNFPEYKDVNKAKSIMSFIEDKDLILEVLLNDSYSQDINIIIGNENIHDPIKDCSIVTATYRMDGKVIGQIGVIGPTRMDYLKLINTVRLFSANMTEIINILTVK